MSTSTTYVSQAFRPASAGVSAALLRELFAVTPLYVFVQALLADKPQAKR